MKLLLVFCTFCLLFPNVIAQDATTEVDPSLGEFRILTEGCFHGDEIEPFEDENWFGLFASDSGYILESVSVSSAPCFDAIVDMPGDTTGIAIESDTARKPVLLIQSAETLEAGGVAVFYTQTKYLHVGEPLSFQDYSIVALGELTDEGNRLPFDLLTKNYRLKLYDLDRHLNQILVEFPGVTAEGVPSLIWAGDLDRDRKLDLFMDMGGHYNVTHLALFLSSAADEGELVKLVAEFRTVGC